MITYDQQLVDMNLGPNEVEETKGMPAAVAIGYVRARRLDKGVEKSTDSFDFNSLFGL